MQFGDGRGPSRQFDDRANAVTLQRVTIGCADVGHVDEGVLDPPLRVAHRIELAVVAVRARFGPRVADLVFVQQGGELATEPSPVRAELLDAKGLADPGAEPQVHLARDAARQGFEGVRVEAQLEHVSRLALDARQLRVNRLVYAVALVAVVHADQEVRDAANAVVHQRHLVDDVVPVRHRVADSRHPLQEGLVGVASRDLVDTSTSVLEFLQTVALVLGTLFDKQIGQRSQGPWFDDQRPRVGAITQREEVRTLQPRRDLGRGYQTFDHSTPH